MDNRPIGVFDSGLGGLTTVRELLKQLPGENIIYFGDTGRVPYGNRSREIIRQYARQDARFLLKQDAKLIVAACGTVSSVAGDLLKKELPVPYTDVLEPTVRAAIRATKNGRIGVIATQATIRSGSYQRMIEFLRPDIKVYNQACPLLVPIVESGFMLEHPEIARAVAETYIDPLKAAHIDTLILGCTHYPLLKAILGGLVGEDVRLIDSGKEAAFYCRTLLEHEGLFSEREANHEEGGTCSFHVSDRIDDFSKVAEIFLQSKMEQDAVSLVDIEAF